ncbi:MAG: hypothetical protein BZ138_00210 [Methanosphaera sp. rholeuAM270]|nr:MAG: hypothetical protein BZ138_00210 [Methanosphaera sp. rholeuAM270]
MVLSVKKIVFSGLGKKVGFFLTIKNIKLAMIMFDKVTRKLDYLEERGYVGSWNSGKKFKFIKKANSKIVSKL